MILNEKLIPKPVVLYENANGSNGNITLNDNVSNYDTLEIYYTDNNKGLTSSARVKDFNNKDILLYFFNNYKNANGLYQYVYCKKIKASGNQLTITLETYMQINNTNIYALREADYIYITKVLGYKN